MLSTRAQIITRRTYNREISPGVFETWEQTVDRVIQFQEWLWRRALTKKDTGEVKEPFTELTEANKRELEYLREIMLARKALTSGRSLWLANTDISKSYSVSQFNCSSGKVETVYDVVDNFWLLLSGCGIGVIPVSGQLTGFRKHIPNISTIRSTRTAEDKGKEENVETWNAETKTWTIKVGDSALAWAKAVGKLLAGKYPAHNLVLDFSEIRGGGFRLRNYGWISSGDEAVCKAFLKIASIMNTRADRLLTDIDIIDVMNLLGTVLSTRRSATIVCYSETGPHLKEYLGMKNGMYENGKEHRAQSNNSIVIENKPSLDKLKEYIGMIAMNGNGEPGLINKQAMQARSPWAVGTNACAEILLNSGFCSLVEIVLPRIESVYELMRIGRIIARANYRQTLVDLRDGLLQEKWHLNQEYLRLCGVGLTGISQVDVSTFELGQLRRMVQHAAYSMAEELDLPYPKQVTCIKPSGTLSKIADVTEGLHSPLGQYIFNNVVFSVHDPLVKKLLECNYKIIAHPSDESSVVITLPVEYSGCNFTTVNGKKVNNESAIEQLERYKKFMQSWCDQNCSITVSYEPDEISDIAQWLHDNWDVYVAVSFLPKIDATKSASDLGYPYLPQEVVSEYTYKKYVSTLLPVVLEDSDNSTDEYSDSDCATGACPIK